MIFPAVKSFLLREYIFKNEKYKILLHFLYQYKFSIHLVQI